MSNFNKKMQYKLNRNKNDDIKKKKSKEKEKLQKKDEILEELEHERLKASDLINRNLKIIERRRIELIVNLFYIFIKPIRKISRNFTKKNQINFVRLANLTLKVKVEQILDM